MFNRAILIGRMTADPELKQTNSGKSVSSFCIAVARPRDREKVDFLDIVTWGKTAEFVNQWFHKGDPIGVEGPVQTRSYEDKNGNKRTSVEIVATGVFFVGSKSTGKADEKPAESEQGGFEEGSDENDLPFN